ncbi:MAG: rhomboid family intramembrane serine protease, partial [archaeon]
LLLVFGGVYLFQQLATLLGYGPGWFSLAAPADRPWTLITSVYAHASLTHLGVNALALAIVGFPLERFATRVRFHAFVLATGVLAGLAEITVASLLGPTGAVMGASGAILGLYGYALAGNPVSGGLLTILNPGRTMRLVLLAGAAVLVTILTAGTGIAVVAHATGFVLGLLAGRKRVLNG